MTQQDQINYLKERVSTLEKQNSDLHNTINALTEVMQTTMVNSQSQLDSLMAQQKAYLKTLGDDVPTFDTDNPDGTPRQETDNDLNS